MNTEIIEQAVTVSTTEAKPGSLDPVVLPSSVYFAAAIAAEKALPETSRALIERHDELHREWRKAGWPSPIPNALAEAGDAVRADALANFAMELRRRGNEASHEEYRSSGQNDQAQARRATDK